MSRFFKSAAFPIIVVVVLAFFAQRMIIDSSSSKQTATWNTLVKLANEGRVQYLKTDAGSNSVKYSTDPQGSQSVTLGVPSPDSLEQVISSVQATNPTANVTGTTQGGSPW